MHSSSPSWAGAGVNEADVAPEMATQSSSCCTPHCQRPSVPSGASDRSSGSEISWPTCGRSELSSGSGTCSSPDAISTMFEVDTSATYPRAVEVTVTDRSCPRCAPFGV